MTALAGRFRLDRTGPTPSPDDASLHRMLAAMRGLGADRVDVVGPLGLARHAWESEAPSGVASHDGIHVAASATLYYRDDLRRTIGDAPIPLTSDGALILAAYERFGDRCVEHLEGDFAFIIWDARRRRILAARDFVGRLGLFIARHGESLDVASTLGGLLALPEVPRELSLRAVAITAAGMWNHANETAYRAITDLPAGHRLVVAEDEHSIERYWQPPSREIRRATPFDDAAEELRGLLVRAVHERMAPAGPTALSLSGGWDSSAVFGAGQAALRAHRADRALRPVSISYPPGDPGREDELIEATVRHWDVPPRFRSIDEVAMFADVESGPALREEPFAHAYENWNRELARMARAEGARVLLDGSGGDQLFQVSDVFLADLFRRGQWVEFARQWRERPRGGWRALYRATIGHNLPAWATRLLARARRMPEPEHYLHRDAPPWFRRRFLAEHDVLGHERRHFPRLTAHSHALAETQSYLLFPYFSRVMRTVTRFSLEEGVTQRSPLLDARIVRFAAARPWHEKSKGPETKRLLRAAMRGLIPDEVLAPRARRTGVTTGYFMRRLTQEGRPHVESMFVSSRLADLGIIDPAFLRRSWELVLIEHDESIAARLYLTLQAELWLRSRIA